MDKIANTGLGRTLHSPLSFRSWWAAGPAISNALLLRRSVEAATYLHSKHICVRSHTCLRGVDCGSCTNVARPPPAQIMLHDDETDYYGIKRLQTWREDVDVHLPGSAKPTKLATVRFSYRPLGKVVSELKDRLEAFIREKMSQLPSFPLSRSSICTLFHPSR